MLIAENFFLASAGRSKNHIPLVEIQNQNHQECFLRAICIFCKRFSGSHYKWRLFISVLEVHANQVVAQTSPGKRTLFIQKRPPPPSLAPHSSPIEQMELQLLGLIQPLWQPNTVKLQPNMGPFLIWFKKSKLERRATTAVLDAGLGKRFLFGKMTK